MENFLPVSNLSFISKLTERVVLKRLTDHILCNNLREQFQSAYKPNHSTETALMRVQNGILMSVDNKRGVVLIMLDLSAEFDTVYHLLLLGRMRSAGVFGIDAICLFRPDQVSTIRAAPRSAARLRSRSCFVYSVHRTHWTDY